MGEKELLHRSGWRFHIKSGIEMVLKVLKVFLTWFL